MLKSCKFHVFFLLSFSSFLCSKMLHMFKKLNLFIRRRQGSVCFLTFLFYVSALQRGFDILKKKKWQNIIIYIQYESPTCQVFRVHVNMRYNHNWRYAFNGVVSFSRSDCKLFWFHTSLKVLSKNIVSRDQIGLTEK